MKDEKINILNMLKEGKITSEEAKKLLESNSNIDYDKNKDVLQILEHKDLKKDVKNTITSFTKIAVDKTFYAVDKLFYNFFSINNNNNVKNKYKNNKVLSHTFELENNKEIDQLDLSSFNGPLLIKGFEGDKLKVKVKYEPKIGQAKIDIISFENKYCLSYDEVMFNFISVEAFIPHSLFKSLNIECINGIADISSIKVESFFLDNLNDSVKIRNIESKYININVNNGSFNAINVIAKKGNFEVSNGNLNIIDCDIQELNVSTYNGLTDIYIYNFINFIEYIWNIKSFNGKILIKIPEKSYIGYDIKAQSRNENVKLGLKKLEYLIYSDTLVEGRSINYDETIKHIKINTETSNAQLSIN